MIHYLLDRGHFPNRHFGIDFDKDRQSLQNRLLANRWINIQEIDYILQESATLHLVIPY